jgi:ADP-ribosyl-[dinitrogen reductase] hydrolase
MPTPLTLSDRARGAMLGFAVGNALGLPAERFGTAAAIRGRWPGGLSEVLRQDTPASPYDDDVALAVILAEELVQPDVDLRRLAHRWIGWARDDGRGLGAWTRTALAHIATHDSPPAESGGRATNGAVSRCLPVALRAHSSPRNLVSGTLHTAALTHPDPRCGWSAVAVNVAAACFLRGRRDFVPEVIEALRTNEAAPAVLDAVRRVPLLRQAELDAAGEAANDALTCMTVALWYANHEPLLERGLVAIVNAGGDTDTNAAVAGGLMGARDGARAVPGRWLAQIPGTAELEQLALELAGAAG